MVHLVVVLGLLAGCALGAPDATDSTCMSGIPCGTLCAPIGGACISGQCYDASGMPAMCYAPMAGFSNTAAGSNRGNWWFAPLFPLRFTMPMAPMPPMPPLNSCGGKAPCSTNQFCDPSGTCRPNDCLSQFKYGCHTDTGAFEKIACPHHSGFTRCYASTSGGFTCYKGQAGMSVACASQNGGSSFTTMTSSYQAPGSTGVSSRGSVASSSSFTAPAAAAAAAVPTTGVAAVAVQQQQATSGAASMTAGSTTVGSTTVGSTVPPTGSTTDTAATGVAASSTTTTTTAAPTATVTAAAAAPASSSNSVPAASTAARTTPPGVTVGATVVHTTPAPSSSSSTSTPITASTTTAAAAGRTATAQPGTPAVPAKAAFIVEGSRAFNGQQAVVSPDGSTVTAFGSGPPGISMVNVAPDGSSMAAGSAMGDHQSVTTTMLPGGSSVTSTSFSGPGSVTAPASAAAAATAVAGTQPVYTPFANGQGNAATAAFMGTSSNPSDGSSSSSSLTAARATSNGASAVLAGSALRAAAAAVAMLFMWTGL